MAFEIRPITDDEVAVYREAMMTTFGTDVDVDPGGNDRTRVLLEPSQTWAAFDGGTMVGTAGTFNHAIGVPGGTTLPIAGLTMVTVRPTHRRRGILRSLIERHLADARERGLPVSALWASEASIYQRFGYGTASYNDVLHITNADSLPVAAHERELDRLDAIDEARARVVLPAIYARATAYRPGALRRSESWWRERRFLETQWARKGASRLRHVVASRNDELVGYVVYRQRGAFTDGVPSGSADITELHAIDPRAEATLWRFMLSLDLFPTVTWWNAPTDCPLPWLVPNARRIRRHREDNLWLRIEDVPTALAARHYPADGTLRFAIEDQTWALTVEAGRAQCAPTVQAPELRLDRSILGALYLGSTTASQLARADVLRGDPRAIARADAMFASSVAAWCPEIF
jgi:predicted acetyltransferase